MRPSAPSPALRLAFAAAVALTSLAALAPAQAQTATSDADRDAARNLFKEGYDLQRAGNYAEALERFQRSQQVYPAPTALLHIAECQAGLLHLVEAAETYRTLGRLQLPDGSPPAFLAAQAQGAAELQQVEPRISHVRIDVKPAGIPGLTVTVDGQPMNLALLGVERAFDPGDHKVTAVAPGYDRAEAVVPVVEREPPRTVVVSLTATPGVFVPSAAPSPDGAPVTALAPLPLTPTPQPRVVYVTQPQTRPFYTPQPQPYYGAPALPAAPPPSPPPPQSRMGLFVGPRLGVIVPNGSSDLTDTVTSGASLGVEVNYRFARRFFTGLVVDHGFLGTASALTSATSSAGLSAPSFSTTNVDAVLGFIGSPDRFSVLLQGGLGYRTLAASSSSASLSSPEVLVGAGLWIPIGRSFRLVPRVDTTFGSLSGSDAFGNNVSYSYGMVTLALGGYYNIDFR